MGDFLAFERFIWFHRQIRQNRFPNAITLADRFEISERTAQRSIEFMRQRLDAPLEYDHASRGYFYGENTFDFPQVQATQEEILAILLARNLLSESAGGLISRDINRFGRKLLAAMGQTGLTDGKIREAFSATWTAYSPAPAATFQLATKALLHNLCLSFDYSSPLADRITSRTVEPHHLQHYNGNWTLLAWCRKRRDWRKFLLCRMSSPSLAAEGFPPRPRGQWHHLLGQGFGLIQGQECVPVVLRFTPDRARRIREQIWHPEQKRRILADGGLELTLPAADFREIKLEILRYGAEVEVIEPPALREEIRREIDEMRLLYAGK